MRGRGIIIWLIGIGLLGIMAAYLFSQSNKNKKELDRQASRNVLLVRENLRESLDALTLEIRSFIVFKSVLISSSPDLSKQRAAALSQGRDPNKFKFRLQDKYSPYTFSYLDSLTLSGIGLETIIKDAYKELDYNNLPVENDSLNKWINGLNQQKLKKSQLSTRISFNQWLEGGLRKSSFFDVVFLANEDGEILYPSLLAGTKVPYSGKSMAESFSNSDVSHFEMDVSAAVFEGYLSPMQIGEKTLWVGGLKDQEEMDKVAYSIDYNILVITALMLLILLLSLPLISFFEMGKGDVLSQRRVYLMGVSLLMIFMVSGFALSYLIFRPDPIKIEEANAIKVRRSLQHQFELIRKNLNGTHYQDLKCFKKSLGINEEIIVDSTGALENLRKIPDDSLKTQFDFTYINIKHRNYFKYYFDPKSDADTIKSKYYLERIFSQKNGKSELVMSARTLDKKHLNAITFKFTDTLIHTNNKGYLLIKENGEVLFSSEKFEFIFTQIKTALPEDKWENLHTLIQSNKDGSNQLWRLPMHLNGKEYIALISKFGLDGTDSPIWFIYLVNTNMYHSLTGMMVVESIIWLCFYGLILLLISLGKSMFKKTKGYNWENFTYNGFHPKKITIEKLKQGAISFVVFALLIYLVSLFVKNKDHFQYSIVICILIALFFALFNHFILPNRSKFAEKVSTRTYSLVLFFWLFFIGFLPGFWISSGVFKFEGKLWNSIQKKSEFLESSYLTHSTSPKIDPDSEIDIYYRIRAGIFSRMDNGFDPQLRAMIFPNTKGFSDSVGNIHDTESTKMESSLAVSFSMFTILLFLSIGFGIYILIKKLVRNIYWTDFDLRGDNELGPFISQKLKHFVDMRIFLCGCDSRKNRDWIQSYLGLTIEDLEIVNCAETSLDKSLKGLKQKNKKALLVENIHCLPEMKDFIRQFPQFLNSAEGIHLIFSSGITWRNLVNQLKDDSDKVLFSEMISDFYFEIVPISFQSGGVDQISREFNERAIEEYFNKKGKYSTKEESPHLRLLLQRYGKAYFYNIWAELSIEEKNVCYSYSKEGFFNFKNREEIIELFQKGIISKDEIGGQLQLFSKTFRYFILSIASDQVMQKITKYRKENGNASNTQWALFSFLLVAFALLSYFDRSFLTELQAIITGVTGISTLIISEARKIWISRTT